MPIYEYRCDDCGEELEKLQRMSDEPLRDCPSCGKPALRRLVSAAGFRLKGSGWYETDFKQDKQRNLAGDKKPESGGEAKSESTGASGGEGKSGGSAESKPAAKSTEAPAAKPASTPSSSSA